MSSSVFLGPCLLATSQLLLFVALLLKNPAVRKALAILILFINLSIPFLASSDDFMMAHTLGDTAFIYLLSASDILLLNDGPEDFKMHGQKVPATRLSLFERVKWAANLIFSPRAIGWAHGPPPAYLRRRIGQQSSRRAFVLRRVLRALCDIAMSDLASYVIFKLSSSRNEPYADVSAFLTRRLAYLALPALVYSGMDTGYCLLSAFAVGFGFWEPQDWPSLYGSISEANTVRHFWGKTWHQAMRRPLAAHGAFIAHRVLRLKPGIIASFVILGTAFTLSGIVHAGGDIVAVGLSKGGSIWFFSAQAAAILLETLLINLGRQLGCKPSMFWRSIGRAWVLVWCLYMLPLIVVPLLQTGRFASVMDNTIILRHLQ